MIRLDSVLTAGGVGRVRLFQYAVMSIQLDPLFVHLARQYRNHPTGRRAVALYDVFCGPRAHVKLTVLDAVPPRNLQIQVAVEKLRASIREHEEAFKVDPELAPPPLLPAAFLFDKIVALLREGGQWSRFEQQFDPTREAAQNLPSGKMSSVQVSFVNHSWRPLIRPHLVSAGFPELASIG